MDTYTIPFKGELVVYKPRRHLAFIGNSALAGYLCARNGMSPATRSPSIEQFLDAVGFDRPGLECAPAALATEAPLPTGAVLLMTNRCNLRCVYCYANAGAEPRRLEMDWATAKAVIDFVLANASRAEAETPSLTFHGGGEPTVHWDLLVRAVEYAKERDARTRFSMSSNGVWSDDQRQFICRNFANVSLSMDGAEVVQNRQRPRTNGTGSFSAVMKSIQALDAAGIDYGIRMTVLEESVGQLAASVRFICENTKAKAIQIEPTFTSSRGIYSGIHDQFAAVFSERFMDAWRVGREAGRQVYYSAARPWVLAPMFCQAPLKAAVATADGRLVTCFEVFSEQSPMASGFTVGRIREGRVEYDRGALQKFLDVQQERRQECVDCFCYWHCAGDCATRRPGGSNASAGRCLATRNITLAMLLAYMEEDHGVWQGLRESPACTPSSCDNTSSIEAGKFNSMEEAI